jgi:hypothetical protein
MNVPVQMTWLSVSIHVHCARFNDAGMGKESDYALYAGETDKTLGIRDTFTMAMSRAAGLWAPKTAFVDVYVNPNDSSLVDRER